MKTDDDIEPLFCYQKKLGERMGFPTCKLGGTPAPKFLKNNFQWSHPPQFWAVLNTLFTLDI